MEIEVEDQELLVEAIRIAVSWLLRDNSNWQTIESSVNTKNTVDAMVELRTRLEFEIGERRRNGS